MLNNTRNITKNNTLIPKFELCFFLLMVFAIPLSEAIKNVAFILAFLCFCFQRLKIGWNFSLTPFAKGLFIYFTAAFICSFFAVDKSLSFKGLWDIFRFSIIYFILIADLTHKKNQIEWTLILSTTIGALWGILVWKILWHRPYLQILSLGHFNHTSIYLAIILILTFCKALWEESDYKWLLLICCFIMSIALVLTTSRGSLVGFGTAILGITFLKKYDKKIIVGILILLFILSTTMTIDKDFRRKGFNLSSLKTRFWIWKAGMESFRAHFWCGLGLNCFKKIDFAKYKIPKKAWQPHAHNLYINTLAQTGIIGFWGLLSLFTGFLLTWKDAKEGYRKYAALGTFIIVIINGIFNTTLHHEHAIAFMLVSGLIEIEQI